jgi:hypothetical protein
MIFNYLLSLFFNIFDTYFLEIPVLLNWIFLGFFTFFYIYYQDVLFFFLSSLSILNLIILFFEDYNMFNNSIENQLYSLIIAKNNNGFLMINNEGLIIMINDNFKKIFQNSQFSNQFFNINNFIGSLNNEIGNSFKQNLNLANESNRIIYYDILINDNNYQITFEKIIQDDEILFLIFCNNKINNNINNLNSITNVNNSLWQEIINDSNDGHCIIDNNEKIIIGNKKFIEIINKPLDEIKYNFLNNVINDPHKYLTNFNYYEGIIIIDNNYYIWKKQKINDYYWFTFTNKNYTSNKNFDTDQIIYQNPLPLIVFDKENILFMNDKFNNLLENTNIKLKKIENIFFPAIIDNCLNLFNSLTLHEYLDIIPENSCEKVFKTSIKKLRIYPMDLVNFQTFIIFDITNFAHQEQQLFHAQRLMTTGEILSGIIHDLNNDLMPILG